jgi:hypothetical protein
MKHHTVLIPALLILSACTSEVEKYIDQHKDPWTDKSDLIECQLPNSNTRFDYVIGAWHPKDLICPAPPQTQAGGGAAVGAVGSGQPLGAGR